MRYAPLRLFCGCFVSMSLWVYLLYLSNHFLSLPAWVTYGAFAGISAGLLFFLFHRYHNVQQYQHVFNTHPIPMWIYECGTLRFLAVNQAAIEKYGFSRKEFLSLTITDIRDPEEEEKVVENRRLHQDGAHYRGIWKHSRKDGTGFYAELYGHDQRYLGRKARVIMAVDVDEKIKESLEAKEMGIRYELLAKATKDAIFDWDAVNDYVIWNHGLYTLFGYQPDVVANTRDWWLDKLHPDDRERVLNNLRGYMANTDAFYEQQYRILCANGRYKNVLSRGYIIREDNVAVRVVGLLQDIDPIIEKQRIIRRLLQQGKGLREIAWINSHEIRRPVVSILGITQLLTDQCHEDPSLNNQLINWLHTSTSELDDIIHKLEEKVREIEHGPESSS